MSTPARSVTAKVVSVLSAFEGEQERLSLTQIARHAGLPMSTAHRMVSELVELGALRRDDHGRYRPGRRIWKMAQNAGRELSQTARPHLADLFQRTARTCHVAIRDGDQAMIIDRIYSTDQVGRATKVGDRLPLHASAVGKVLLAAEDEWMRDAYLARGGMSPEPPTSALGAELVEVRQKGFATAVSTEVRGVASVAVPVSLDGYALASLGLVMASTDPAELIRQVPVLQAVAREMTPALRRWPNARAIIAEIEGSG